MLVNNPHREFWKDIDDKWWKKFSINGDASGVKEFSRIL